VPRGEGDYSIAQKKIKVKYKIEGKKSPQ